jgi:uncharacterized protein (TIGR00369 family)
MNKTDTIKRLPNTDTHNCFACGPKNPSGLHMTFFTNNASVFTWVTVPSHLCGWNNLAHGGVLSTILDEIMSWAAMYLLKGIAMTRSMTVEFLKPVYVGDRLKAEGNVLEVKRQHQALLEGLIYDVNGELHARSTGNFAVFSPRVAQRLGIMDEASIEWFETVMRCGTNSCKITQYKKLISIFLNVFNCMATPPPVDSQR